MSESESETGRFCACLKSPWKKITKGLKEINACNNCNIAIGNSSSVVDNRSNKTEISNNLKELHDKINSTENTQLKAEFQNIVNQIEVSMNRYMAYLLYSQFVK